MCFCSNLAGGMAHSVMHNTACPAKVSLCTGCLHCPTVRDSEGAKPLIVAKQPVTQQGGCKLFSIGSTLQSQYLCGLQPHASAHLTTLSSRSICCKQQG